ncbi:MAG: cell envelope integrity protein TolA [Rhizobacter sp.]
MHHPVLNRDDLLPRPPAGMGRGLMFAIAAHVLLVAALTFSVNWNSSDPAGVEAELWSAVPQIAAQRVEAQEPPPPPEPPKPEPKPVPKPVEAPPPPKPAPDPQIAIEKEKEKARKEKQLKEEKLRDEQERKEKLEKQKADEKKAEDKKAEEKKLAEKKKQDAARQQQALDAQREAQLKRILAQAGADNGSPGGTAMKSSGASSSYAGRIVAAVKPRINFAGDRSPTWRTEVEIRQGPDGTILSVKLLKGSGSQEWDNAVLRAAEGAGKLPRDIDGSVQPQIIITFKGSD